ncbi:LemA protein [Mesoflavibacter sabulilitoris]|uniref:LemA family protein n=1 Tax=Mesoflavibacter zeaxanthinifaciens subsp. sabulilitoris TaxID=1520893 RepID=A0A2T1NM33_9FLAO|nr:LemA family protein [Mesoflavibacter zeaxanthinifaciens]MBB3124565.1 LemA protein [Mesoflavibacter zeaxanthinifaciens subsp. sabulilitoris]PSG93931.1 LemA family protein [Mesoflavibacter zeaxanthinifaciens subsp. sabulilitoris]
MKKWLVPIILIALAVIFGVRVYNSTIGLEENVEEAWAKVESSYQRRSDLIGNLVKTVQGAADFEKSTLESVINARAKATSINIDPTNITPEQLQQFNQAQSGLSSALSRLLVTVERYPDLKANQNFLELQSQLEGTENRINVARDRFNETVKPYNKHIRTFPNNLLAGLFGFEKKAYFEAEEGSEKAPDVEFDFK